MIVYKSGDIIKAPSVVMLGMFDGLHIGHKKLIETAKSAAAEKNLKTVLYTFSTNPKADKVSVITNERKIQLCSELNIDSIFFEDFTDDFKRKTPAEFTEYLKCALNASVVVTGFDYRFGFKHAGTVSDLRNRGFDLIVVPEVALGGEKVSSSAIRKYIENGEIAKANAMLGFLRGEASGVSSASELLILNRRTELLFRKTAFTQAEHILTANALIRLQILGGIRLST